MVLRSWPGTIHEHCHEQSRPTEVLAWDHVPLPDGVVSCVVDGMGHSGLCRVLLSLGIDFHVLIVPSDHQIHNYCICRFKLKDSQRTCAKPTKWQGSGSMSNRCYPAKFYVVFVAMQPAYI